MLEGRLIWKFRKDNFFRNRTLTTFIYNIFMGMNRYICVVRT